MSKRSCIAFLLGLAVLAGPMIMSPRDAHAHGTGYRTPSDKPAALEFYYSTGDVMAYQEAKVYSPRDEKFVFQSGRTDEYGRFAFTPDVPGRWRVTVKDMEGHLSEAVLDVPEEHFDSDNAAQANMANMSKGTAPEGLYLRAALGVSVLFNIAAFTLLYRRVRKVL